VLHFSHIVWVRTFFFTCHFILQLWGSIQLRWCFRVLVSFLYYSIRNSILVWGPVEHSYYHRLVTCSFSEERHEFEKRLSNWSNEEPGDDAVSRSWHSLFHATIAFNMYSLCNLTSILLKPLILVILACTLQILFWCNSVLSFHRRLLHKEMEPIFDWIFQELFSWIGETIWPIQEGS